MDSKLHNSPETFDNIRGFFDDNLSERCRRLAQNKHSCLGNVLTL